MWLKSSSTATKQILKSKVNNELQTSTLLLGLKEIKEGPNSRDRCLSALTDCLCFSHPYSAWTKVGGMH